MGHRVKINTGQEFTSNDQHDHQKLRDKFLQEMVLRRFFGNNASACFFSDDCKVASTGGMGIEIGAGLGFQYVSSEPDADESKFQAIYLAADQPITVNAADPTNPRIDIVVIKSARVDTESESRYIMDGSGNIASQSVNTKSNDTYAYQYIAGTPAGSPVEPATPSGYVKIATISVPASAGSISQSNITDNRIVAHRGELMSTGRDTYYHSQMGSPSNSWVVNHNLGTDAQFLQVMDANGQIIGHGPVTWGANQTTITFAEAIEGYAYFLAIRY